MEESKTTPRTTMKQTLADILLDISWARLSTRYFGRSRSWLHQKLDGRSSNGGEGNWVVVLFGVIATYTFASIGNRILK